MEEASRELETVTREPAPGMVGICARELLPDAWPLVREWLEAALMSAAQHEWTIADVCERVATGQDLLLLMGPPDGRPVAAAVVTKSSNPHGLPYIGIVCCGGSHMETWLAPLLEACKAIARTEGAKEVVALGRPGWVKALKPLGIKHRASIFSVEV